MLTRLDASDGQNLTSYLAGLVKRLLDEGLGTPHCIPGIGADGGLPQEKSALHFALPVAGPRTAAGSRKISSRASPYPGP